MGRKPVVSSAAAAFFAETPDMRFTAILFRGQVFVACPRHLDAINLAFDGMTHHTKRRIANRVADGKEAMLFGSAKGDGSEWEWNEEFQGARMLMYGFD